MLEEAMGYSREDRKLKQADEVPFPSFQPKDQKMKLTKSWENLFHSGQGGQLSRSRQCQSDRIPFFKKVILDGSRKPMDEA